MKGPWEGAWQSSNDVSVSDRIQAAEIRLKTKPSCKLPDRKLSAAKMQKLLMADACRRVDGRGQGSASEEHFLPVFPFIEPLLQQICDL